MTNTQPFTFMFLNQEELEDLKRLTKDNPKWQEKLIKLNPINNYKGAEVVLQGTYDLYHSSSYFKAKCILCGEHEPLTGVYKTNWVCDKCKIIKV